MFCLEQTHSQNQFWTFWTQKVDFLNLIPLTSPTKTSFSPIWLLKVDLFGKFGVVLSTPPPSYGLGLEDANENIPVYGSHKLIKHNIDNCNIHCAELLPTRTFKWLDSTVSTKIQNLHL